MYAVIRANGHQYKVKKGDSLTLDRLPNAAGEKVEFKDVLMLAKENGTVVGSPVVADAKVVAEVCEHTRGEKVLVFKYKRRKNYKKMIGHRQSHTVVKITDITG